MSKARITAQKSVTSSVTPSSKSGHIWSFDEAGNVCINIENCVTGEDLKIPAPESVVTGIKFPGDDEIYAPDDNGCITLPADKFSTGELSEDGTTLTVIMDGLDVPVDICLDPIKGAVILDADGEVLTEIPVIDGILQLPDTSQCWGYDDNGDIVTNIPNCITGELLVICGNPVKEVTQGDDGVTTVIYADESSEQIEPSYAVDNGDGTTTTYHPDGSEHTSVDDPVLDVLDPLGVSLVADGVAQLSDYLQITESADGSTGTVTNTLTGDSCTFLKTVDIPADVSVVDYGMTETTNADGSTSYQFVITMSDGTVFPAGPVIDMDKFGSVTDNGDGTGSVTDPVTGLPCTFIKSDGLTSIDGSVVINGTDLSVVHPDPVTSESTDGSVDITATATGYDFSVTHPDPKTVESADASVVVTPTATGCDLSVTHPDPVTAESSDGSVGVAATATGYDFTVVHPDPKTVESADGSVTVTPTATGCDLSVPTYTESSTELIAGGSVITTSDGTETFVCDLQVKDVQLNPLTNMWELLDQNGDPVGDSWFAIEPENRVKLQVVTTDGEVLDGNGVSVPATAIGGVAINANDIVAVECDPDGNVVTVALFPTDTSGTVVNNGDGTATVTGPDGVAINVCLNPVKTVNGVAPDINGNVNAADLFSNTVDNGDGTYTTTNSDGSTVTWSGDTFASQADNGDGTVTFTMADSSTVTLCLNPVKSVVGNPDGTTTVTYADGTVGTLPAAPQSTAVSADGTTTTTHPDGTTHVSCDNPVKSTVENADGSVTVTYADGTTGTLSAPVSDSLVANADGSFTHTAVDGTVETIPAVVPLNINDGAFGNSRPASATDILLSEENITDGTAIDAATKKVVCKGSDGLLGVELQPCVSVIKNSPNTYLILGDVITYEYSIHNCGPVPLVSVSLTDDKIGPITVSPLPIASGATVTVSAPYTVTQADIDAGFVYNLAAVTASDVNGNSTSNFDDETVYKAVKKCGLMPVETLLPENGVFDGLPINTLDSRARYDFTSAYDGVVSCGTVQLKDFAEIVAGSESGFNGANSATATPVWRPDYIAGATFDNALLYITAPANTINGLPQDSPIWSFTLDLYIQNKYTGINNCPSKHSSILTHIDFDNASIMAPSLPWDSIVCDNIEPTEISNGVWEGAVGTGQQVSGGDCTVVWNTDAITIDYQQATRDGLSVRFEYEYQAGVCFYAHPLTGEIILAETAGGVLPESEFANIIQVP